MVEFSPATREARVRFPANATLFCNWGSILYSSAGSSWVESYTFFIIIFNNKSFLHCQICPSYTLIAAIFPAWSVRLDWPRQYTYLSLQSNLLYRTLHTLAVSFSCQCSKTAPWFQWRDLARGVAAMSRQPRQRSDINMSSSNWRDSEFLKLLIIMWEKVMQSH